MVAAVQRKGSFSHGVKVTHGRITKTKSRTTVVKSKASVSRAPAGSRGPQATCFPGFQSPTSSEVTAVHRALAAVFGERRPTKTRARREILDTVVGTILSQNTTNTNSHRAFTNLKQRFKSWDAVRLAKPTAVEAEIKCGGLAPKKTKFIQDVLKTLYSERGETSLEYLRKESKEAVHEQLERFSGIGKKTAAIINLFDVGHPDMAVDTHVFRYAIQLGWVPTAAEQQKNNARAKSREEKWPVLSRDTTYQHLDAMFPDRLKYSMHLIMTDTEKGLPTVCTARDTLSLKDGKLLVNGVPLSEAVRAAGRGKAAQR